jgi:hypothetical protein
MKEQGLDVKDERGVGGAAWWLNCSGLPNSLVYTIDTYRSKMDVLEAGLLSL